MQSLGAKRNIARAASATFAALLACISALAGCGYHTAGKATQLPATLHTLSIPAFTNRTLTYHVEQTLTAAVVREFQSRTHYRVVGEDGDADATLKGTVLTLQTAPLTYDSTTGHASSYLVTVTIKISLVDHDGKVLYENPNYVFRQEYEVARELSSFFEESSPALERLSNDFAHNLVGDILEAY